jgi:hypothetical protein
MATAQKFDDPEAWQVPVAPQPEPEETPADRVALQLAAIRDDDRAKVKLSRVLEPGRIAWCADYTVAQFEAGGFEMIRREWGPGEYQIVLYAVKPGSNYYGIRTRDTVTIAKRADESSGAALAVPQHSDIGRALQAMADQQRALVEALSQRPPPADPMAQIAAMFGLMKGFREAMGLTEAPAPKSSVAEIIAGIKEIRGVADELTQKPDTESEPSVMQMLPKVLELVQAGMAQQAQPMIAPLALPPAIAGAQSEAAPVDQPSSEGADVGLSDMIVKGFLRTLVGMAEKGSPIDPAAEMVADHMPDDMIRIMESPAWFEVLKQVAPVVAPHEAWFTRVRDAALKMLAEDEAPNVSGTAG